MVLMHYKFFKNGPGSSTAVPDIVLLDLNMPIMGGFDFLQAFQDLDIPNKEKILFIIITSYDAQDNINRAKSFGIKHFLVKPVSAEMIKSAILDELGAEV